MVGGAALIALALIFMGLCVVFMRGLPPPAAALTATMLLAPLVMAGLLFIMASQAAWFWELREPERRQSAA